MILADTSVWIDHLRKSDADLARLLNEAQVVAHPFVVGEISLGSLKNRAAVLAYLKNLPSAAETFVSRFPVEERQWSR